MGDFFASDSRLTFAVTRVGTARLARLLDKLAPDAVVTVHATPSVAMSHLAASGRRVPPHTTVVTDFVAHSQWIASHIDRYCVAAEEVKHEFIARGIAADRILITGVPVRAEFEEPVDQPEARHALGLPLDRPVALAMAGSQGSLGRLEDIARTLVRTAGPVEGVVIAGRDERLAARLRALTMGTNIQVRGYTSHVRRYMAAADLLITKAGGMTLAEALAAEVPVVTYGSLPGQERRNERFASRAGIALVARSPRELARVLERAFGDRELLKHLRERIRRVRRPDASRRVVSAILERELGPT